jgi:hypothetical protein
MKPIVSPEVTKARVAKWMMEAKPVDNTTVWTERRLAIVFGEHTYLVTNGQVFQCAHCGHYDPQWSSTEVMAWFKDNFKIEPIEIEITCTVAQS